MRFSHRVVLDRVGQQVQQDLRDALSIRKDGQPRSRRFLDIQEDAALYGDRPDQFRREVHTIQRVDGLDRQRQVARFNPCDVEDFISQCEEVPTAASNLREAFLRALSKIVQLEQLRKAEDRIEWRPKIMAHPRKKFAFGPVRKVRVQPGPCEHPARTVGKPTSLRAARSPLALRAPAKPLRALSSAG
jgi:hypothetical protein